MFYIIPKHWWFTLFLMVRVRVWVFLIPIKEVHFNAFYVLFCFLFSKSIPISKPSLIQSTLNKIDSDALRRYLKKSQNDYPKGVFEAWSQWVLNINKLFQLPTEWEWQLDILQNCDKLRPAIQDVAVPGHLTAFHDKETEEKQHAKLNI